MEINVIMTKRTEMLMILAMVIQWFAIFLLARMVVSQGEEMLDVKVRMGNLQKNLEKLKDKNV